MLPRMFSWKDTGKPLKIKTVWLLARCTDTGTHSVVLNPPLLPGSDTMNLAKVNQYGGLHFGQLSVEGIEVLPTGPPLQWVLKMTPPGGGNLQNDSVADLMFVVGYDWDL